MRAALTALVLLAAASPAEAQWAALRPRPTPTAMQEGRPLADIDVPDPLEVWCRTQPPSRECGGFPVPNVRDDSMRAVRRRLIACAERSLRRDPELSGRVVFEITITRGRVEQVRVIDNSISDTAIVACLGRALRVLRLPIVTGTATLRFPVMFSAARASGSAASR